MSDWELVENNVPNTAQAASGQNFEWEIVPAEPVSQQPQSNESLGLSALKAPYRIGEDLYRGAMGFIKNIPEYYNAAKTEIPGAFNVIKEHPGRALAQLGAGVTELGHNLLNTPRGIADYAANRLNLFPQEYAHKIPYQEDISNQINQLFGNPEQSGEKLIRGLGRNALTTLGGAKTAQVLNPLNITNRGIAKNVLKEQKRQMARHGELYNNLFRDAEAAGYDMVPVSTSLLDQNLDFIRRYKSPGDYKTLEYFRNSPTLENAQSAMSDLKTMMRNLDEKSKKSSLTGEERNLYDAAENTIKHIESNMFLNPDGTINTLFANRYRNLSNSYRENVVPYRYNKNIQDYLDKKITSKELVNSLSRGEFAAKKGMKHPSIKVRNALPKALFGTGALGGLGWLYDQMFGDQPNE